MSRDEELPMQVADGVAGQASTISGQAAPTVRLPKWALRRAISNAETSLDDALKRVRELEGQRDEHVRSAGRAQVALDGAHGELNERRAYLRTLTGLDDRDAL